MMLCLMVIISMASFTLAVPKEKLVVKRTVSGGSEKGDPHMTTFDGRRYSFQGQCWYTFFKDCSAHPDFEVISKFGPRDDIKNKTRTVSFKVTVGDQYVIVNGRDVATGSKNNGHVYSPFIHVQENNDLITLAFTSKYTTFTLEWTPRKHMLKASFSGTDYNGKLCGLMGNADGDTRNDLQTPDGFEVKDVTAFGESWKVKGEVCD
ncbi:BMP-binding endothelial regulator protein-like isoform X2 [Saccoglossus kowalevskii]